VSDSTHALLIRWTTNAYQALVNSLAHIENEDTFAARLVLQRVEKSLLLLAIQPGMGTMTARPGVRRYHIPQTGHTINYRIVQDELRILRWYRQRQQQKL